MANLCYNFKIIVDTIFSSKWYISGGRRLIFPTFPIPDFNSNFYSNFDS